MSGYSPTSATSAALGSITEKFILGDGISVAAMSASNRFVRFGYRRPLPWPTSRVDLPTKPTPIPSSIRQTIAHGIDHWPSISTVPVPLTPISINQHSVVPTLAHGLDVVLQGDGLYPLETPWLHAKRRQRAPTHFSDGLRHIVHPDRIAWAEIPPYIPASHDANLHGMAARTRGVRFCSSTSSITPSLSALYHLISNFMDTALTGGLSAHVNELPASFSRIHRRPIALMLTPILQPANSQTQTSPLYSVNAHSGVDRGPSILRDLGHSMERMFTTPPDIFAEKYVRDFGSDTFTPRHSMAVTPDGSGNDESNTDQASITSDMSSEEQYYHYTQASNTLLRAQIDCRNAQTGQVFDVKTRAVAPIRYDLENYEAFKSHRLRFLNGRSDSYEREFYDMVRSVFLKYALQLRIGRMGGAFVAYHNTTEVLGMEYISLAEMESYVFGNTHWADVAFATSLRLFEEILGTVSQAMSPMGVGERVKVVLCTEWSQLKMTVFAQRVRDGDDGDAFSSREFAARDAESEYGKGGSAKGGAIRGRSQWHFDSFVHERMRGVSIVGAHEMIKGLGGERVDRGVDAPRRKAGLAAGVMDYRKYDYEQVMKDGLNVWELSVVPMVNGELMWNGSRLEKDDDQFSLRYTMQEMKEVTPDHMSKFVMALATVYMR